MPKKKQAKRVDAQNRFDHRVEAWIRASHFAVRGVNLLLHALIRQQGPGWANQRRRTRRALKAFEESAKWIRISHSLPVTRDGDTTEETGIHPHRDDHHDA